MGGAGSSGEAPEVKKEAGLAAIGEEESTIGDATEHVAAVREGVQDTVRDMLVDGMFPGTSEAETFGGLGRGWSFGGLFLLGTKKLLTRSA